MASPPPLVHEIPAAPDYAEHVLLSSMAASHDIPIAFPFVRHGDVTKKFGDMESPSHHRDANFYVDAIPLAESPVPLTELTLRLHDQRFPTLVPLHVPKFEPGPGLRDVSHASLTPPVSMGVPVDDREARRVKWSHEKVLARIMLLEHMGCCEEDLPFALQYDANSETSWFSDVHRSNWEAPLRSCPWKEGSAEQYVAYRSPCNSEAIGSVPMARPFFGLRSEHQPPVSEREAFTRGYPPLPGADDGRFGFPSWMRDWKMTQEDPTTCVSQYRKKNKKPRQRGEQESFQTVWKEIGPEARPPGGATSSAE